MKDWGQLYLDHMAWGGQGMSWLDSTAASSLQLAPHQTICCLGRNNVKTPVR